MMDIALPLREHISVRVLAVWAVQGFHGWLGIYETNVIRA